MQHFKLSTTKLRERYKDEGLEGYFRDSGFGQNTVRESGKR